MYYLLYSLTIYTLVLILYICAWFICKGMVVTRLSKQVKLSFQEYQFTIFLEFRIVRNDDCDTSTNSETVNWYACGFSLVTNKIVDHRKFGSNNSLLQLYYVILQYDFHLFYLMSVWQLYQWYRKIKSIVCIPKDDKARIIMFLSF